MTQMQAVGFRSSLPVEHPESLVDLVLPMPVPGARDLVVEVLAASVNPVDSKERQRGKEFPEGRVLGYDGAGVVTAVGPEVTLFKVGDEVYYAGDVSRPGSNAQFEAIDERIVAHKPSTLSFVEAAALPLTAMTAWEGLFDRLKVGRDTAGTLLVLGGAGGVASMVIQLAKKLTGLTVIGTSSRPESREWITRLGVDQIVDHSRPLAAQVQAIVPEGVRYVFSAYTAGLEADLADAMAPESDLILIDGGFDATSLRLKSISVHWEWMFTRSFYQTPTMINQHEILTKIAAMVDDGRLKTTASTVLHGLSAESIREAHRLIETGRTMGKIVIEY